MRVRSKPAKAVGESAATAENGPSRPPGPGMHRRSFLRSVCAVPVGLAAARPLVSSSEAPAESVLPQARLGKHRIARLVLGSNPFHAGSHLSVFVNLEMARYYTPEQKLKTLRRCEEVGITCWQGNDRHLDTYRLYREQGGTMQYISLGHDGPRAAEFLRELAAVGCIAVAHHGEVTDRLFKTGHLDTVHDYVRRVRDAGMLAGVSTHMPDVVDAVESRGWDIDFYMTCVYERHRSAAELEKLLGQAPIPVGEVYLPLDPPRMFRAIRQTHRTCLAFKILAAGRLSQRREWVEEAFRRTLESIKTTDAVIVGIYDRYADQPAENAAYVRRFGSPARA